MPPPLSEQLPLGAAVDQGGAATAALRRLLAAAGIVVSAALGSACSSDSGSDAPTATPTQPMVAASDCSDIESLATPIATTLREAVVILTGQPATGGGSSLAKSATVVPKATVPEPTFGSTVLNVGLTRDDPLLAESISARLSDLLAGLLVPAIPEVVRVRCETGRTLDGRTAACYDVRLRIPRFGAERLTQMKELSRCNWASKRLQADPVLGGSITYAESKGFASGDGATLPLALRGMLDAPSPTDTAPAPKSTLAGGPSTGPVTKEVVTATSLAWSKSRVTGTLPFANVVFAPGFSGSTGATGTWVMFGLGATVQSYSVKCLQAQFRDLATGETRLVSSGSACTGDINTNTYKVTLDGNKVAVGYALSQSSGTLTGVALAWGTPNKQVDPLAPDYLTNVSPTNVVVSGSVGNGRPDFTTLSESATVEVLLGVGLYTLPAPAPGFSGTFQKSEWWGTLASPDPLPPATWNGYTPEQLQSSVVSGLNQQYDAAIPSLTYQVFTGCNATIPQMNFCGNVSARYSSTYSPTPGMCEKVCLTAYDVCYTNCIDDSCRDQCVETRRACSAACSAIELNGFTQTAAVGVSDVRGLELLDFETASLPPTLPAGTQVSVDVAGSVPTGLVAPLSWELCLGQVVATGRCTPEQASVPSSAVGITARSTLEARACPSGPAALYLTINEIVVTQPGVWSLDPVIARLQTLLPTQLDALAPNVADVFATVLKPKVDTATASALTSIRDALNGVLGPNKPLVGCSG
jgi:hypothetical protein